MLDNTLIDVSNFALVLLANEKFEAVTQPMAYMAKETNPGLRLFSAFVFIFFSNGIRLMGQFLKNGGIQIKLLNLSFAQFFEAFSTTIRSIYSIIFFYM